MPTYHIIIKQKRHKVVAEDELDAAFMVIHNLPKYFDIEITDDYQDSNFIWTRNSADNAGDIYWNEKHSEGSKQITLSLSEDVLMGADFNCSFILDGEVLATLNDN